MLKPVQTEIFIKLKNFHFSQSFRKIRQIPKMIDKMHQQDTFTKQKPLLILIISVNLLKIIKIDEKKKI